MVRDWLYKATGAGDGDVKSPSVVVTGKKEKIKNSWSSGCMSGIYNKFLFRHPSLMSSESIVDDHQQNNFCLQGIEAPRNSLESPVNIPVSKIHIKTNRSEFEFTDGLSTECYNSPGSKTPNLVARLMGLDLLPEYSSPRASSSSATANNHHRSRSLPATPRLSTASRHSTDGNDYYHRLSLQINTEKENDFLHMKIKNKTKERTSRRLGTDITNTMTPARGKCPRRDSNLVLLKPKKASSRDIIGKVKREESKHLSRSPNIRLLDIKANLNKPNSKSSKPYELPAMKKLENVVKDEKIKRITSERYDMRLKKKGQQEKVFVNKKSTTNVNNTKKFQTSKKVITSCSSNTRLSQKQVSLPSNLKSSYNSNNTHNHKKALVTTTTTSATSAANASCSFYSCEVFERSMRRVLLTAFVAEVEEIVVEIEREILGDLVYEIVTAESLMSHVRFT